MCFNHFILHYLWNALQKFPKAAPFRNKGWPLFDEVKLLMPTIAKGRHVYRATQGPNPVQSQAIGSDTTQGEDSGDRPEPGPRILLDGGAINGDDDHKQFDDPNNIRPESPPPSSVSHMTSKRKFSSTIDGSTPSGSPSPFLSRTPSASGTAGSNMSSSSKRGRMTGAIALHTIGESFSDFTQSFRTSVQHQIQPPVDQIMLRKNAAMKLAEKQETNLSYDQLATLFEIFEDDVSKADAYTIIENKEFWEAWVRRKLERSDIHNKDIFASSSCSTNI